MRNLLRSRRGSVAFATVVALVPLIGVVALGAEAGSWYVTKQHAQNAADAAAYSGALRLACSLSSSCTETNDHGVIYRGKQFAAQNAFCDSTENIAYPGMRCITLPSGTTQTVAIEPSGNQVRATVRQTQQTSLANILGLSNVTIGATAVAQVDVLANPCVLSLSQPIAFGGSTNVQAPGCGLASNSTAVNSMDYTGNGLTVNAGSISGAGGCKDTGGTQCNTAITYAPPVPDPLSPLQTAMSTLTTGSFTGVCALGSGGNPQPVPYTAATQCYNNAGNGSKNFKFGNANYPLNGVYFFSGSLSITGSPVITGTATIILLPGATLSINGGTIQLTALETVTADQVPTTELKANVGLLSKLLIYDPEVTTGNNQVRMTGNSSSYLNGIVYAPNASVMYQGSTQSYTCVQVIANAVTLTGNSNFNNSGCPESTRLESRIVKLVE